MALEGPKNRFPEPAEDETAEFGRGRLAGGGPGAAMLPGRGAQRI